MMCSSMKKMSWMAAAAPMMPLMMMAARAKRSKHRSSTRWMGMSCDRASGAVWDERSSNGQAAAEVERSSIVETAVASGQLETLLAAVQEAGLAETLAGPGPFTVFAPTDEAFAKLPEGALEQLLEDPEKLRSVLLLHVVPGRLATADLAGVETARTVSGASLTIETSEGVKIQGSNVSRADIFCSNGVVHLIDQVMLPE